MTDLLNKEIFDIMSNLSENGQDMLIQLFHSGIILPNDTIERALIKVDENGNEQQEMLIDRVMHEIADSKKSEAKQADVVTLNDPAKFGQLQTLGFFQEQEKTVSPADNPEFSGVTIHKLLKVANPEEAEEIEWLATKYMMNMEDDVSDLLRKCHTIANPKMDGMMSGGLEDISVTNNESGLYDGMPTHNLSNEQIAEHNKIMRAQASIKLIKELVDRFKNPEQVKFLQFLNSLDRDEQPELFSIIENGFKLIHKN